VAASSVASFSPSASLTPSNSDGFISPVIV
jgi:hypothetical protein